MDPQSQNQPQAPLQPLTPPVEPPAVASPPPVVEPEPAAATADTSAEATRSQVVEQIQKGKNVLVTVGTNPSVDELASALGLTLMLSSIDKRVTAVFSGDVPPAIEFLDPEATFENTVDSLRDFIIALSKEKADKLRYKVEDDVVKIFITPYKTTLGEKDFEFSQGDFNVDVILALGVHKSEELDKALTMHGTILHDTAVVTVNAGSQHSDLGAVDWNDPKASSIAEMLVGLSDQLGTDLLDEQTSTALLTGIVAETNRFSNEKTTPKIMTISAQLMAAGANQQLVATNLRQEGMISESVRTKDDTPADDDNGEMVLPHGKKDSDDTDDKKSAVKKPRAKRPVATPAKPTAPAAEEDAKDLPSTDEKPAEAKLPSLNEPKVVLDKPVEDPSIKDASESLPALPELKPLEASANQPQGIAPMEPVISSDGNHEPMDKPTFGGTLNATTATAEDDRVAEAAKEAESNNLALSHDGGAPNSSDQPAEANEAAVIEAAREAVESAGEPPAPIDPEQVAQTLVEPAPPSGDATTAPSNPPVSPSPVVPEPFSPSSSPVAPPPAPAPEEPEPVDAFMQTHAAASQPADLNALTNPAPPMPGGPPNLPPLPPMPGGTDASLPPLPPMPGQTPQNNLDPTNNFQPQINPGFMQDMPQGQNNWSQAAEDLGKKQAEKAEQRQDKIDQMNQQYDTAVDRNRELQGLPPLNDPNGSGLPPVPPAKPPA